MYSYVIEYLDLVHCVSRYSRNGEKYYIQFIDNLLLFLTVKEFSKLVNS